MQYDDVGCSSMFQLTHSASSINSDASDRSSKSGTVRPLTSLQPLNPSTCPSSKVKLEKKPNNLPKRHGCICNGSHLPTGFSFVSVSNYFLHFSAQQCSLLFSFSCASNYFLPSSSGRATRPGGTSQEGRCSSLPPTRQRTGVQDCNFYRTHVFVHGVRSLGPGVSKSH